MKLVPVCASKSSYIPSVRNTDQKQQKQKERSDQIKEKKKEVFSLEANGTRSKT